MKRGRSKSNDRAGTVNFGKNRKGARQAQSSQGKSPKVAQSSKEKGARNRDNVADSEKLAFPITESNDKNTTRVVVQDGEAVLDMQVSESDDELFRDEGQDVRPNEIQGQNANLNPSPMEIGGNHSSQGDSDESQNNNANVELTQRTQLAETGRESSNKIRSSFERSEKPEWMEHLSNKEGFMEDFAQFMVQKGYIYRENSPVRAEVV